MDDLFLILAVLLAGVFIVWMTLAKQAKQIQAQAAEVIAGLDDDVPQSQTFGDLGIAIASLEAVLIHLSAARADGRGGPTLLSHELLAAQSQLHEIQMQVEDRLDLPEADTILEALARAPSVAEADEWGWPEADDKLELARSSVREAIAYLEAARSRVRAEDEARAAEQLLGARLEAEVRHTEAVEAAREAGTPSARTGRKERS